MEKVMENLPQYHFDRDDFCAVVREHFTWSEFAVIEVLCGCNTHFDDFSLFRVEDEFYILHRDSGILINWYKHAGRTNTCNNPDFSMEDFRVFLTKLREELVWAGEIKDDALLARLHKEFYEE